MKAYYIRREGGVLIMFGCLTGLFFRLLQNEVSLTGLVKSCALGIAAALATTYLGIWLKLLAPENPAQFFVAVMGAVLALGSSHRLARTRGVQAKEVSVSTEAEREQFY